MSRLLRPIFAAATCIVLACAAAGLRAQTDGPQPHPAPAPAPPALVQSRIEAYASEQHLSAGYSDWRDFGVRGTHVLGSHLLLGELSSTRHFDENGAFASIGDIYTFNPDWYGQLSVGAGDGASYLPRVRVDSFLNRKLLAQRNLVATLGLAYYHAPDGHTDRSIGLGAIYYFSVPLVIQGEFRRNVSSPGDVATQRQFLALSWMPAGGWQVTGRHAWGEEGYQPIGAGQSIVDFHSRESSLEVRKTFGAWGVSLQLDYYSNPVYVRRGAVLGVFREFR